MPNTPVPVAATGLPSPTRRALLGRGLPATLAVATMPAAALTSSHPWPADPYVALGAAYFRHWDAGNNSGSDEEGDAAHDAWAEACQQLLAARPTTTPGVIAGLKVALNEFRQFRLPDEDRADDGDRLILMAIESAIAVLEREQANA